VSHFLHDIGRRLDDATELGDVIDVVRVSARALAGSQGATFVLRDGQACFYADEDSIAPLWKGQRFPITECISGWAMLHGETAVIPDIMLDERIPHALYRPTFVASLVMVPIGRDEPVGAIGAYWSRPRAATAAEVAALERLADLAAAALARIGLDSAPWAPRFGSASIGLPDQGVGEVSLSEERVG
jgi:GAF domain-containing protein